MKNETNLTPFEEEIIIILRSYTYVCTYVYCIFDEKYECYQFSKSIKWISLHDGKEFVDGVWFWFYKNNPLVQKYLGKQKYIKGKTFRQRNG